MSFQPYDRNPSGIVFFGTGAGDQLFESNSNFTIDGTTLVATNLAVSDGGTIGSASDADAITIASNGDVTFSQDISIAGDLTVNGTTTTVNSTTVTIDDPIFTLGGDTAPASDDNKDRGIEFNWHNGSTAKVGFFGFDDSTGKFTFIPDATNTSEVFSGTAGTIVADLEGDVTGNADTASAWATSRTITLGDELSGNVSIDGSANVTLSASLTAAAITGLTDLGGAPDATNDFIMIYDASATALRKVNRTNFVSGLGAMSSFTVTADSGTNQQVDDGETLDIAGGTGIATVVGATNTVTVSISAGGVDTTQLAADAVTGAKIADDAVDSEHLVDGSVDNVHLAGGITFAKLDGGAYLTSAEAFSDSDTQLMTAAAIDDRILSYGYSTTTGTVTSVGGTGSVNGITLTGTVTSTGSLTLGGTLGNITLSQLAGSSVITSAESFSDDDDTLMTSAAIDDRILSYGYSTTTGTVTSVATAGTVNGLSLTGGTITGAGTITLGGTLSNVAVSNMAASAIQTGTEVGATGGSIGDNDTSLLTAAAIINFVEGKGYSTTTGTVTSVATTGSVNGITLTGGTITSAGTITLGGTLSNIANSQLTNSAITIAGVSTSLGGSITANTIAGAISAGTITNAQLANDSVSFGGVSLDLGQSDATPAFNLTDATNYKFGSLTRVINSSAITSDGTVSNDISIVDSTSGAVTMTLPTPANGLFYTIKKVDSSSNAVIVDAGTGSATLDGGANFTLYHQYETVSCVCDGTNWHIV